MLNRNGSDGIGNEIPMPRTDPSQNTALQGLARVGHAVNGVLHLVMGWIILQVAWQGSAGGKGADQNGAFAQLADNALGKALLWLGVVGFSALALWELLQATVSAGRDAEWTDRAKEAGKGVVHIALAITSFRFATGGVTRSGSGDTQDTAKTILEQPAGRVLVVVLGLVVIGVGIYHVHKGLTKGFLDDLRGHPGATATRAGVVGFAGKGVSLVLIGGLFALAGLRGQSGEARGLDGAVRGLRDAPAGPYVLTLIALGIAAYGLFALVRARHEDLSSSS